STIRTARSRSSAGYLPCLGIAPSSQGSEPPQDPGRFTYTTNRTPASTGTIISKPGTDRHTTIRDLQTQRVGECLKNGVSACWPAMLTRSFWVGRKGTGDE